MSRGASPPIRTLAPLEKGGVIARKGFNFQDHVAVAFCLEMLTNPALIEVWCETQDDMTLISQKSGHEAVEFVQVKSHEFDQLWTIAKLCEKKINERSILEKSLAQDRCQEECYFRIVTVRDVRSELKILTYPFDSPLRVGGCVATEQLCAAAHIRSIATQTPGIVGARSRQAHHHQKKRKASM
jgi:Cap4-like dsDNA endonuclease family protein